MRKIRYFIFLKDVFFMAISAFGGPQAHIAIFLDLMVSRRRYLSERELIELNALCQILPGPTSTQTLTAIGFKIGGPILAFLTLIVWIFPAMTIMTLAGLSIAFLQAKSLPLDFTKFIQPMAVAFVAFAAYRISIKVIETKTAFLIMIVAAFASYFFQSPYAFPILLLMGGTLTAFKFNNHPIQDSIRLTIDWSNFILWAGVFIAAAILGAITGSLPIRLFENFYRNGSLIFGGGQVLIPFMYTEFVEFKEYLSSEEFLSGYAFVQAVPGPTFSFCAYIGALSMRDGGISTALTGAFLASAGIFLPGTFLIFFIIRFWDELKKRRVVKASLEGINAVSSGMVASAAFILLKPIAQNPMNWAIIIGTFLLLQFTKIPAPIIIIAGLFAGFVV